MNPEVSTTMPDGEILGPEVQDQTDQPKDLAFAVPSEVLPSMTATVETDRSPGIVAPDKLADGGHALPFPVVAIGGSAGALEAFIQLFQNLSPETGMAFVVLLHLAPNHESHLTPIIARHTRMQTVTIEDGMAPQPNCVYVLPPNAEATLRGGRFRLQPRNEDGPFLPIDALFLSLAAEQKNYGIGVVLSGMDGDGALGLRAIKGEGGFSMVQSLDTARHGAMPRASIATEHVDMVLAPELIARQLMSLSARFGDPGWRRFEEGETSPSDERVFARILRLLNTVSGVDFRLYKPTTIRRRVARRMLLEKIESISEYSAYLQGNATELRELQEDVLIGVTRFFRDTEVWEALKANVIPQIFDRHEGDQQIRVWVAGCSSGEEVYSIAMLLLEHLTGSSTEPAIQIFGTDASEASIQKARLGLYPESIVHEVSPERLRRFFTKTEKGYQIAKRIRDLCIFARQNLCSDPPFSRLDLVSCRNVLIYFGAELQRQVIATFHYALRQHGFLLLGSSEMIREFGDMFALEDGSQKIFVRRGEYNGRSVVQTSPQMSSPTVPVDLPMLMQPELRKDYDLSRMADRIILARHGPPGVVVNDQMEILQIRGRTSPFLEIGPGQASLHLARIARESIAAEVVAAVSRAIQADSPVHAAGLQILEAGQVREASLQVLPMHSALGGPRCYLVLFLVDPQPADVDLKLAVPAIAESVGPDRSTSQLHHDLASTRLYLQSLLDERDTKNQELVSANEEIQSANEELQSTNEELQTTKEELQSSNEELQTVNDELSNRNTVLTEASNDLTNLLNSVNLPVLMLSSSLTIRHFTPQTQRLMSVRATDVGRPFGEIRLNLKVDNLEARLLEVLETLTAQELEVQDHDGRWYLLRIRPYRTTENKIDGLVLVLVDIDQHRKTQQELRDARDFAASVIASIPLPLVVVDSSFAIYSLNDAFCTLSALSRQALESRSLPGVAAGLWKMEAPLRKLLNDLQQGRQSEASFECEYGRTGGVTGTLLVRGRPLQPDGHRFILVTFEDITAHKEVEGLLKREGERLAQQVAVTTRELDRSREELRALTDNLMTSQEDERRRLARELHDDVSQRMALLDMECEAGLQDLGSDVASARAKLEGVRARIAEISQDVRTLSHRLHPSIIEHLGPAAALESLLDEFARRDGMLVTFFTQNVPENIPLDVGTGLYRIAQEALRNVAKHAGRAHVKLSLTAADHHLNLEVADSGVGFDAQASRPGLGLVSMKERARLIGATLSVHSEPRQGTRVDVRIPLTMNPPTDERVGACGAPGECAV